MNVLFNGLGRFTVRFRWFIVVVWIVGTAASVHFLPSLASQVNNDNSAFLPASAPSTVAGNLAEPLVGKASLVPVIIIGVSQHGPISAADTQAITRLAARRQEGPERRVRAVRRHLRRTGVRCNSSSRRTSPATAPGPRRTWSTG